ncbi:MAG: SEL1-like repeat protein [Deltaproteobacteria bacterium]|nr:SEL1-like repeat protein [Deltaproteobacteria bacterium]
MFRCFYSVASLLIVLLAGCGPTQGWDEIRREPNAGSTFAKFRKLAEAGDANSQNLIGFMFYFGEGAPHDRRAAHRWFHLAAEHGNKTAQVNLAIMHYLGEGVPKDLTQAERYFRLAKKDGLPLVGVPVSRDATDTLAELAERAAMRPSNFDVPGESTYATFCAGCHGLNGIAAYEGSPSFALAERLEKTDAQLLRTITEGHGVMPAWKDKLTAQALTDALGFVRTLPLQYQNGIAQVLRTPPSLYFLFGPMSTDATGLDQDYPH